MDIRQFPHRMPTAAWQSWLAVPANARSASPHGPRRSRPALLVPLALAGLLGGCAWFQQPEPNAAVVAPEPLRSIPEPQAGVAVAPAPAREPRPSQYKIKPGDSLIRIGLDLGYSWRDIAKLNQIKQPYPLQAGKVLKLPEAAQENVGAAAALSPREELLPTSDASGAGTRPIIGATSTASATESGKFQWPGGRSVLADFATTGKGLDIDGRPGEPVHAAADGRVVYAGSALPGYGQVVILKHDEVFLSAYGHNQRLLAKEGTLVHRGDTIAVMGSSGTDRVKLRFEIRREGVPVDPMAYLSMAPQPN